MVIKSRYKNEYLTNHYFGERVYNVDKFIGKKQIKSLSLFRGEIEKQNDASIIFHRGNNDEPM